MNPQYKPASPTEYDELGNFVQMYELRREMGDSIQEAFEFVQSDKLQILIDAVAEFDRKKGNDYFAT